MSEWESVAWLVWAFAPPALDVYLGIGVVRVCEEFLLARYPLDVPIGECDGSSIAMVGTPVQFSPGVSVGQDSCCGRRRFRPRPFLSIATVVAVGVTDLLGFVPSEGLHVVQ